MLLVCHILSGLVNKKLGEYNLLADRMPCSCSCSKTVSSVLLSQNISNLQHSGFLGHVVFQKTAEFF